MKELNYGFLYNCFKPFSDEDIKIIDIEEKETIIEITLENCGLKTNSIELIQDFLGQIPVFIKKVPNSTKVILTIGKIELPNYPIQDFNLIKKFNDDNKIFLGLTSFGYQTLPVEEFTSNIFIKRNSSGCSTFFINLISQIMNIKPTSQHIIIESSHQYNAFKNLSNVIFKGNSISDLAEAINFINLETIKREYIFKEAFEQSPESLTEYSENKDVSHPVLDPIYLWVDDFSTQMDSSTFRAIFEKIASRSSKVGIYISCIDKNSSAFINKNYDIYENLFLFDATDGYIDHNYNNNNYQAISQKTFLDMQLIPGRFFLFRKGIASPLTQSFNTSIQDSMQFINHKKSKKHDFIKFTEFPKSYFNDEYNFLEILTSNNSLDEILSTKSKFNKRMTLFPTYQINKNPFWKNLLVDSEENVEKISSEKNSSNQIIDNIAQENDIFEEFFLNSPPLKIVKG